MEDKIFTGIFVPVLLFLGTTAMLWVMTDALESKISTIRTQTIYVHDTIYMYDKPQDTTVNNIRLLRSGVQIGNNNTQNNIVK